MSAAESAPKTKPTTDDRTGNRRLVLMAGLFGAAVSAVLTSGLVNMLEREIDFTDAARTTFGPIRILVWAAIALYLSVPVFKVLKRRSRDKAA